MELRICVCKINNHGGRLSMEEPRLETETESKQRSGEENKRTGQIRDRSSIESKDKSRCSDRYFSFFFIITVEIAQMEMLIAKYTPLCGSGASWAP